MFLIINAFMIDTARIKVNFCTLYQAPFIPICGMTNGFILSGNAFIDVQPYSRIFYAERLSQHTYCSSPT